MMFIKILKILQEQPMMIFFMEMEMQMKFMAAKAMIYQQVQEDQIYWMGKMALTLFHIRIHLVLYKCFYLIILALEEMLKVIKFIVVKKLLEHIIMIFYKEIIMIISLMDQMDLIKLMVKMAVILSLILAKLLEFMQI